MIRSTMRKTAIMMFAACLFEVCTTAGAAARPSATVTAGATQETVPPEPAVKPWQPLPGPDALARRKRRVLQTIEAWAQAWSQQSFETYISAYADDFPPGGLTHEFWIALRRKRVMEKAWIHIRIESPKVHLLSSHRVRVTFMQVYQSPSYSDRARKALTLQRTDAGWRIVRETSTPPD